MVQAEASYPALSLQLSTVYCPLRSLGRIFVIGDFDYVVCKAYRCYSFWAVLVWKTFTIIFTLFHDILCYGLNFPLWQV